MIEARGLTKRYGSASAVNDLSFTIRPGTVTGFLGPNGAGKTTTMRLILGLDYPTAGTVTVNGKPLRQLPSPMREVGALLDARAVHGGRSAYSHLLCLAQTNGIPARRVDEVLGTVGLTDVARKRSKGFSLGMSQRLGIAAALLGDPGILMFDEPVNGLDPEGIAWIRNLMRSLAAEGRTVFVSSHLMSEMEHTADHLLVIGRGRLIADSSMAEFIARGSGHAVLVRTPQPEALARAVTAAGGTATHAPASADTASADTASIGYPPENPGSAQAGASGIQAGASGIQAGASGIRVGANGIRVGASGIQAGSGDTALHVRGLPAERVGDIAFASGIRLHHLAPFRVSLEQAFMELTADSVEYHATGHAARQPALNATEA